MSHARVYAHEQTSFYFSKIRTGEKKKEKKELGIRACILGHCLLLISPAPLGFPRDRRTMLLWIAVGGRSLMLTRVRLSLSLSRSLSLFQLRRNF